MQCSRQYQLGSLGGIQLAIELVQRIQYGFPYMLVAFIGAKGSLSSPGLLFSPCLLREYLHSLLIWQNFYKVETTTSFIYLAVLGVEPMQASTLQLRYIPSSAIPFKDEAPSGPALLLPSLLVNAIRFPRPARRGNKSHRTSIKEFVTILIYHNSSSTHQLFVLLPYAKYTHPFPQPPRTSSDYSSRLRLKIRTLTF